MNLRQALHLVGAGALTGALLLGSAPTASADDIRDRQWALDAFGAEDIWQHATGKGVTVAVVDTGVDATQADLQGALVPGKDYTHGKGETVDNGRHGTAMAALIAARGHGPGNEMGMKGLAPGAKVMPITVPTASSYWQGIRYAVDHGAKVINLSYDGLSDQGELEAIEYAISKDVVVVAGSGNDGIKAKEYPAAYPGVLSVGGLGRDGNLWDRSSWGSNVSLIAPSDHNVTPNKKSASGYEYSSGTSNATALVSASAALVREAHPDLTAGQVINRLIKSAKPLPGHGKLPDEKFGYGVVRPFRAVTYDYPAGPKAGPLAQPSSDPSSGAAASEGDDKGSGSASSDSSSSSSMPLVLGIVAVVVILAIVLVVVLVKRRGGGGGGRGPQGPGGGGVPYMPPQGQQQYQPSGGQFGPPPPYSPPPPNQPPSR